MKKLLLLLFVIFSISTSYAQIATTVTNNGYCRNEATGERLKVNAERKSKVDDNTAKMQSIKWLGV